MLAGLSQAHQSNYRCRPTVSVAYRESTRVRAAPRQPELAAPPSTPGSVSMVVLCYHQVQAFGRPAPINGSPRRRRRARPRRSNVVFTPVTTHSSGREKVTVSRWYGHEWLNCGLQKPCDTSYYILSEPCHVARPLSRTAVRHVRPTTVSVAYQEKHPKAARSQKERVEGRSWGL